MKVRKERLDYKGSVVARVLLGDVDGLELIIGVSRRRMVEWRSV